MNVFKKLISIQGIHRNAIFSLSILVVLFVVVLNLKHIFPYFVNDYLSSENKDFFEIVILQQLEVINKETVNFKNKEIEKVFEIQSSEIFDPNKASYQQLIELGLPMKNAIDLIALKKSGLYFSDNKSFENWANHFWGDSLLVSELMPYIKIEQIGEYSNIKTPFGSPESNKINIQPFNPFTVSKNELELLGFKTQIAENIIFLRDSIGENKFNPNHIKYMKGLPLADKNAFLNAADFSLKAEIKNLTLKLNLNKVDSLALISVRGIGPYMAGKILAERRALGAFHSVQQIYLIKGLNPEYIDGVVHHFFVSEFTPSHIRINRWDKYQLTAHPYLDWPTALNIVKFRKMYGWYKKPIELTKYPNLSDSLVLQLTPYLSFD